VSGEYYAIYTPLTLNRFGNIVLVFVFIIINKERKSWCNYHRIYKIDFTIKKT
jgi:hypothetical protein